MAEVISKTYGDILFEVAKNKNHIDLFYNQVNSILADFFGRELFERSIKDSELTENEKFIEFKEYFSKTIHKDLLRFVEIVILHGSYKDLPYIFSWFIDNVKADRNIAVATIVSAKELSELEKLDVTNMILSEKKYTAVEAKYLVDNSLIAGIQIRLRDKVLDMSERARMYNYATGK